MVPAEISAFGHLFLSYPLFPTPIHVTKYHKRPVPQSDKNCDRVSVILYFSTHFV